VSAGVGRLVLHAAVAIRGLRIVNVAAATVDLPPVGSRGVCLHGVRVQPVGVVAAQG
jgi:hypothetical protein